MNISSVSLFALCIQLLSDIIVDWGGRSGRLRRQRPLNISCGTKIRGTTRDNWERGGGTAGRAPTPADSHLRCRG